ncbi:R3HC1 protein, partial [Turnix velox]|nr:R3HC1 protein [Turnix velox]
RLPSETNEQKPNSNPPRSHRPPPQPWGWGGKKGTRQQHGGGEVHGDNSRASVGSGRIKRPPWRKPDKALYVPKAMRKKGDWRERENPVSLGGEVTPGEELHPQPSAGGDTQEEVAEPPGGPGDVPMAFSKQQEAGGEGVSGKSKDGEEATKEPSEAQVEPPETQRGPLGAPKESSEAQDGPSEAPKEPPKAHNEPFHGTTTPSSHEEQTEPCVDAPEKMLVVKEEEEKEPSGLVGAPWHEPRVPGGNREEKVAIHGQGGLKDDSTAELLAEIVGHLTVKEVSIEKIDLDSSCYGETQMGQEDLGHVTEIYDFSSTLKTEDLMEIFVDFHESGFKIQWVDDTHALGIFSSSSAASQALGRRYPSLKIRPLIHATKQSKIRALQRP